LKITGRIKEIIIGAGGENIAPVPIEDNFKEICGGCSNIMVIGEQQRFMACILTFKVDVDPASGQPSQNLTPETQSYFKKTCGVDVKTSDAACKEPKIIEHIQKCVEETNKKSVSRAAHIRKFRLIPTDFSIPGGELTPTLKLKRKVTEKKYISLVEEMFAPDAKL
jgi:long-chain-fatty-acid--CoA ligase ACSBG